MDDSRRAWPIRLSKMRNINRVILHCSATAEGDDIDADTIRAWHISPPRNWSDIGYHYVVRLDGTIETGRPISRPGAHTKGHNKDSVGICYVGGLDYSGYPKNTMTPEQRMSIKRLCRALCHVLNKPLALHGHREYSAKACPSFEVSEVFSSLQDWMGCPDIGA
jgi:N-acetylmuramoyl-L-alanine amidase